MDNNVGPAIVITTHPASVTALAGHGVFFSNAWATGADMEQNFLSLWSGQYSERAAFSEPRDQRSRFRELFEASGYDTSSLGGSSRPQAPNIVVTDQAVELDEGHLLVALNLANVHGTRPAAMPMAMVWPDLIPEAVRCTELVSLMDVLPTVASVAGIDMGDSAETTTDGLNLLPIALGMAPGHRALFWGMDEDSARVRTMTNVYEVVNGMPQVIDLATGTLSAVDGLDAELAGAHQLWKSVVSRGWLD